MNWPLVVQGVPGDYARISGPFCDIFFGAGVMMEA
jgi:hypothetical protein